jgi:hypothetical protein
VSLAQGERVVNSSTSSLVHAEGSFLFQKGDALKAFRAPEKKRQDPVAANHERRVKDPDRVVCVPISLLNA